MKFSDRHEILLKGEALFNDVTGTVMFTCCIAVLTSGTFSIADAGHEFALDFFGGVIFGIISGFIVWILLRVIRHLGVDNPTLHVLLELLFPFIIYLVAKTIHVGSIISVVISGMVLSLLPQRRNLAFSMFRIQSKSVWETLEYAFNGIIFVVLGMQLPRLLQPVSVEHFFHQPSMIGIIVLLALIIMLVRFVWILSLDMIADYKKGKSPLACLNLKSLRSTLAMTLAGTKGGITLCLMLTFPPFVTVSDTDIRQLIISIAAGIIVCTLLLANFVLPHLATSRKNLKVKDATDVEISIILEVMETIVADSSMTGSVKGETSISSAQPNGIDEPATIIVLKRYAEILDELANHATPEYAQRAKAEALHVDELYETISKVVHYDRTCVSDNLSEDGCKGCESNRLGSEHRTFLRNSSYGHKESLRNIRTAIEDIQNQALIRELGIIRGMEENGEITDEHARNLRNALYVQQLTL